MPLFPRPIDILNRLGGAPNARLVRGIGYGTNPRQKLDIYLRGDEVGMSPVIVFYYGGSWQFGSREDYRFLAAQFLVRGFIVVIPDYRVYPEARFPAFVEDCAAAAHWVMDRIGAYGGDPTQVFLVGHSAGAYNAVMVALGDEAPAVAGVIGLAGPYDFLPIKDPIIKQIFAEPADERQHQPITFVHGGAPPMFLAAGGRDRTVLPRNTTALAARLRQAGAVVETKIYPKLAHIGILLAILPFFVWRAPVLKDIFAFITACRAGEFIRDGSETAGRMVGGPL